MILAARYDLKKWFCPAGLTGMLVILVTAVSTSTAQKSNGRPYYHEDLFTLRPKLTEPGDTLMEQAAHQPKTFVAPHLNVNTKVDNVLDSINRFNITRKFIEGYTIQIYSGQNREEAMNTKKRAGAEPGLNAVLEYNQPKFRVKVGSYYSRLEAQKDLTRLRRLFSNAILVPEKILVR